MRPDQNELWERYEDAMFTLLMDEVAHQEGQEQLEWKKQLNDDPSAALPEEVRKKGEQTIRKAFAAQSRRSARHVGFRMFQRIAVAVMLVILTAVCAFAAFPEMRVAVLNMMEQTFSDHTEFEFTAGNEEEYASVNFDVQPLWLPDGFLMTDEGRNNKTVFKTYENGQEGSIFISESEETDLSMAVDTEDAEKQDIKIRDYQGKLIEKDTWRCILFSVPEKNMLVYIDAENVPTEQVIKVAENIQIE